MPYHDDGPSMWALLSLFLAVVLALVLAGVIR
jgi:hypothetical protein